MENLNKIPRPEYPRPQMVRGNWKNLNGYWDFEIDFGDSGKERKVYEKNELKDKILVPFCPESELSGINYKDFMNAVWYKRNFEITSEQLSQRTIIHFGAVDFYCEVWINGKSVGHHIGGYTSFEFDITDFVVEGENTVHVYAQDDCRQGKQARGKQSEQFYSNGCDYTRTTGIWQTVWLEFVSKDYIKSFKVFPDPENKTVSFDANFVKENKNAKFEVKAFFDGVQVGEAITNITGDFAKLTVELSEINLWEIENPVLYDLELNLVEDEKTVDSIKSYFGLRSVEISGPAVLINGKPVYQRLVLDQGFYPDGIYTAPTKEDLKKDIEISMAMGFNGARLHQKVFEPNFLYYADKMGYIVWGEFASWGLDITGPEGLMHVLPQWQESVLRDFNHPSIVAWCPFNETWDLKGVRQDDEVIRWVYNETKALDPTRPVVDASGNFHVITDIFDVHDYEQDPDNFAGRFEDMKNGNGTYVTYPDRQKYEGQPYAVSEYGGIRWNPDSPEGWGYGQAPKTQEEFIDRYRRLTETLLSNPRIFSFCYTQLYDVEQEVNGLYTYDRKPKFDPEIIKQINQGDAAIEKENKTKQ